MFCLNCIPALFSDHLIGADIYFHAPISTSLSFNNPFFYEIHSIIYPKLGYYIIYILADFLGVSNTIIRKFLVPVFSSFVLLLIYAISNRITKNFLGKVITMMFVFSLRQFLFLDPSIRIIAYVLFLLQIYLLYHKKFIASLLIFLSLSFVHYEIALHSGMAHLFLLLLPWGVNIKNRISAAIQRYFQGADSIASISHKQTHLMQAVYLLIMIIPIGAIAYISSHGLKFDLSLRNDIPLSLGTPNGLLSALSYLGFFLYILDNKIPKKHFALIALCLLSSNVLFFYSKLWSFYHRYFLESAYIGISILSGYYFSDKLRTQGIKILFLAVSMVAFVFSILPRYSHIVSYSIGLNKFIESHEADVQLFKKHAITNSVVGIHYNDYFIRYIPYLTKNYILGGNYFINDTQKPVDSETIKYTVLSFCGGFDISQECKLRLSLLSNLFDSPSKNNLNAITSQYKLDYLLLTPIQNNQFAASDIAKSLLFIDRTKDYLLYKVVP